MHVHSQKAVALITVAVLLALIGITAGCGEEPGESTSTVSPTTATSMVTTSAVAGTTSTTAPTTSTTILTTTTSLVTTTIARPTGLPTLAEVEGYEQWFKMNVEPVQGRTHGLANIYINQVRATIAPQGTLSFPFPDGTVIVKDILEAGKIAIMRKAAGIDPEHADWQWIEYQTDGTVVSKDAGCWECHGLTKDTDWVYTKLETP